MIDLENGEKVNAVIQDIQFHPVSDRIIHVDFYQLFDDKAVTMDIPVRLVGNSPGGVRNGGRLLFRKRKLTIKALPAKLPDFFDIDINKLKIGGNIAVSSLLNDEFSILHPENTVVVQVKSSRNVVAADDDDEEEGEATEAAAE